MRRLGRQHGNVLCFKIIPQYSRPKARIINAFDGPPTRACFTRAPAKPTNHSRYTSRCGGQPRCRGCHHRPADKARSKTKRAHKLRSHDAALNHGLFFHNREYKLSNKRKKKVLSLEV
ncbi:hypothetical protein ACMD2_09191 [Ananas comosus]|uniref:Uncharacterized protein n=1 Tax=Ananas comosus TaxID=4615 RepID=A0A199W9V4_ANACO|nr:hypothetical protein ACMD2_09191 [Ananas comosus]